MSKAFLQKFYRERQLEAEREQRDQGANQRVTINTTSTTAQDFSAATNHHEAAQKVKYEVKLEEEDPCINVAVNFAPLTPPGSLSDSSKIPNNTQYHPIPNPLKQFAEISLATRHHQAEILSHFFNQFSQKNNHTANLELTPSNSPSPPPAHISNSPNNNITNNSGSAVSNRGENHQVSDSLQMYKTAIIQPPLAHASNNPYGISSSLCTPVQTAPEDLRVVARKIDFPAAAAASADSTGEDVASEYGDSLGEDRSLSNEEISSHSRSINGESMGHHECPDCGKAYSTSSNLARHRQTHRSMEDKKARKCPHCEKTYVSMPAFSMHIRTHNQGCKCHFCGKCFSRPWLLQGHIRTHTGEKPFLCQICNKAFADKSNLRAHIQTHSNSKPFACTRCNKAFALKSYLYKHEESSCMKSSGGSGSSIKQRRKSSGTTVSLTPSPPPITSTTASQAMVEQPFVGQHLLMALSKAREAFRLNQFS